MSRDSRVLCGVPKEFCQGGKLTSDQSLGTNKVHRTHSEAFACYRRYLIEVKGFRQIGPRDFAPADGGPVWVLTKRSRFGARLRTGKEGSRHMPSGKRNQGVVVG